MATDATRPFTVCSRRPWCGGGQYAPGVLSPVLSPLGRIAGHLAECDAERISDATIGPSMPSFPEWWTWELSFVGHAEMRMEQRGVTEVDVRAMLERASGFEPNVIEGRYMIKTRQHGRPWIVIVEPDVDAKLLLIVTVYEVE